MKEIVLISAYTPNNQTQDDLRNFIISLKNLNYRVCLATHTSTPQDIIDRCDYFLYDKENILLYDADIKYWAVDIVENENVKYKFLYKDYIALSTHILPVFRMCLGGLAYLKSLGEEVVHMCEYDTIIKNREIWDEAYSKLDKYDAVCYTFPRFLNDNGSIKCTWTFQSTNVSKIPFDLLQFNQKNLISQYKSYFHSAKLPVTEHILYDNIWKHLNCFINPLEDESYMDKSFILNTRRTPGGENVAIFYFEDKFYFYSWNTKTPTSNWLIVTDNSSQTITISLNCWTFVPLKDQNINTIRLFKDNVLIKELDLSKDEDKDLIFKYSTVDKIH